MALEQSILLPLIQHLVLVGQGDQIALIAFLNDDEVIIEEFGLRRIGQLFDD